jgi:hypothetical protein
MSKTPRPVLYYKAQLEYLDQAKACRQADLNLWKLHIHDHLREQDNGDLIETLIGVVPQSELDEMVAYQLQIAAGGLDSLIPVYEKQGPPEKAIDLTHINSQATSYSDWEEMAFAQVDHPHWKKIYAIIKEAVRSSRRGYEANYKLTEEQCFDLVFFVVGHEFTHGEGKMTSAEDAYLRSVATGASLMLCALSTNKWISESGIDWDAV